MKNLLQNRGLMRLFLVAILVLGVLFVGVLAFGGADVLAQVGLGDEGEVEDNVGEDAAEGEDVPITGEALDQASAAALDYIGEGRVTGTEVGDEEGYYEVEITRDNGRQVDVHLDENFNILGHEDE